MWKRSKSKSVKPIKEDKKPKNKNNYSIQITKNSKLITKKIVLERQKKKFRYSGFGYYS